MSDPDRLWARLPAVHRERDAASGHPLRGLLRIVTEQADNVERDLEQLWGDLFIETCQSWVIPYIGDLVGSELLSSGRRQPGLEAELFADLAGPDLRPPAVTRARDDVARTISRRRRSGTLAMLEDLARAVTGWPAHAVEFMTRVGWTQHVNHVRAEARWASVRDHGATTRLGGPFEQAMRTVDVRRIAQHEGWHAAGNVGLFVWRLQSHPLEDVPARRSGDSDWRFHFSPLGNRQALFSRWRREGDAAGLATEEHMPAPITGPRLHEDLAVIGDGGLADPDSTGLYGAFGVDDDDDDDAIVPHPDASFFIRRDGVPIRPAALRCRRLDPWPAEQPEGEVVAVDAVAGRIAVGSGLQGETEALEVSFLQPAVGGIGGGPYDRRAWLIGPPSGGDADPLRLRVKAQARVAEGVEPPTHETVVEAIADWVAADRPDCVVELLDNGAYALPAAIELASDRWLAIEAADGRRPVLRAPGGSVAVTVVGDEPATSRAALTFGGVVVEGAISAHAAAPRLRLLHTTLVPGRALSESGEPETTQPSVVVDAPPGDERLQPIEVEIAFSICGPLRVSGRAERITLLDSIVDGLGGDAVAGVEDGAATAQVRAERCTLLGGLVARRLQLSDCIVDGAARAERTLAGCVRFSYVGPGSTTPRRYRCEPDLAIARGLEAQRARRRVVSAADRAPLVARAERAVTPQFTADSYGLPGYGQLRLAGPAQLRSGASDGGEMGALSFIGQARRESNLHIRLEEYLPVGLEAGLIYVN